MNKRVALIGYGYWGPNLLRNLISNELCEVLYCCDRDPKKLDSVRRNYPGITLATDPEILFNDGGVEAIVLAVPTALHFPIAKRALEAGKDILIEKPMTLSYLEAKQLVDLATKNKKIIMIDHTFLFNDAVMKIKDLIKSGEIGDILYIDSVRVNLGIFQKDVNVIFDLAAHDFSIINFLLESSPTSVQAHANTHYGGNENVAYVFAEYPRGITTHVHVSWLSPAKIRQMLIVGSKKMIVYDDIEPTEKIRVYDKGVVMEKTESEVEQMKLGYRSGDVWLPKVNVVEPLSLLINDFVDSTVSRRQPKSNGEFGMQVVEVLEKATQSSREMRKIMFNGVNRKPKTTKNTIEKTGIAVSS